MKLNELKPVDQVNFVIEVIEVENVRIYNIRLSNGAVVKCCKSSLEIVNFLDELEFPIISTSKL